MGSFITVTAADGHSLDLYKAEPAGTPRGGVVIIQEIFGVDKHIQEVCDYYAGEGYVAVAPALFDRIAKNTLFGYDETGFAAAREGRGKLEWDGILADCEAARVEASSAGKVGIVGYCFGGSVAWRAATNGKFDCASSYYGGEVHAFKDETPNCPVEFQWGAVDPAIPMDKVAEVEAAHPDCASYAYDGAGHAFTNDHRAQGYHADATKQAKARTAEFFAKYLG